MLNKPNSIPSLISGENLYPLTKETIVSILRIIATLEDQDRIRLQKFRYRKINEVVWLRLSLTAPASKAKALRDVGIHVDPLGGQRILSRKKKTFSNLVSGPL